MYSVFELSVRVFTAGTPPVPALSLAVGAPPHTRSGAHRETGEEKWYYDATVLSLQVHKGFPTCGKT